MSEIDHAIQTGAPTRFAPQPGEDAGQYVNSKQEQEFLEALDALSEALQENARRNSLILRRITQMQREREHGRTWSEIVADADAPLIVELMSQNIAVLTTAGTRLRRSQAQVLYAEGLSMERIAALFGVTRQRVSELLRKVASAGQ